jgi:DNA-binding CsgD family transcriptional regulator
MSRVRLRSQQLYDAVLDDDLFASLPQLVAAAFEARSCVLHWRSTEGEVDILSHSGYFSDGQMQDYADNFSGHDVWTTSATGTDRVNRAWNVEEFVPSSEYERSVFYNEWIRAMGDDTFHCMGSVIQTRWGFGIVGLHRGRTQDTFEAERVNALAEDVVHLRRMLGFRGRLKEAERQKERLAGALDILGNPILVLSPVGQLLYANSSGEELLQRNDGLRVRRGFLEARCPSANKRLRAAIERAGHPQEPTATAIAVPRGEGAQYCLSLIGSTAGGFHQVLVEVGGAHSAPASLTHRVRDLFGLSGAEANVAGRLAAGESVEEIAAARDCAIETVRSQVKTIMRKMGCKRQSEVVRLICRLPEFR